MLRAFFFLVVAHSRSGSAWRNRQRFSRHTGFLHSGQRRFVGDEHSAHASGFRSRALIAFCTFARAARTLAALLLAPPSAPSAIAAAFFFAMRRNYTTSACMSSRDGRRVSRNAALVRSALAKKKK